MSLFDDIVEGQDFEGFKQWLYTEYKDLFDSNDSLLKTTAKIIDTSHVKVHNQYSAIIDFLFKKGFKTYWAMLVSCREGFGEDGGVLLRSIFELLVNVYWISEKDVDERAREYVSYDHVLRKRIINNLEKWKPTNQKLLEKYFPIKDQVLKDFDELEETMKKRTYWSGRDLCAMATDVGLEYDYNFVYRYFSNVVHSSPRSSLIFLSWEQDSLKFTMFSNEEVMESLFHGYWYMLFILKKWNEVFKCGHNETIKEYSEKYAPALEPLPHYKEFLS